MSKKKPDPLPREEEERGSFNVPTPPPHPGTRWVFLKTLFKSRIIPPLLGFLLESKRYLITPPQGFDIC